MPLDSSSPVIWDPSGAPRSRRFDDIYYSSADGLAEARAVFLQGCGLPEAWRGRGRFVVGELGFGSGLNILALLDLWARTRAPGARLNVFSIEAFPMTAADAARALGGWAELAPLADRLTGRWPRRARGFHRLDFDDIGASLDLAVMDVGEALEAWTGVADAWFLDGFAPAANPAMWSPQVFSGLARRSAPGARIATFTVAGAVRRGLAAAGFEVEKRPGFGRKRERLEAVWPGAASAVGAPGARVAIVGAGVAGAALARAFLAQGLRPTVIEAQAPGAGASGNPAGLIMPRLDAGGGAIAQIFAQAFARAADLIDAAPGAVIARGAVQEEVGEKDPSRFDRIADSDLFQAGAVVRLDGDERSPALTESSGQGGLFLKDARVVEPPALIEIWLTGADMIRVEVAEITPEGAAWTLKGVGGEHIFTADIVCIANGLDARWFAPDLPLTAVRGQVTCAATAERVDAAIGGGYLIPTRDGLLFGATHDREDEATDVRPEDHARNLDLLARLRPTLAARARAWPLQGRASLRAATPDFLPLAGLAQPGQAGLFILSGFGSRGFCAAPLLAEHVVALALGAPSPLPAGLSRIVDPGRFEARGRPRPQFAPRGVR